MKNNLVETQSQWRILLIGLNLHNAWGIEEQNKTKKKALVFERIIIIIII